MSKLLSTAGFLALFIHLSLFPLKSDLCDRVEAATFSPLDRITAIRVYGVRDGVSFQNTVARKEVAYLDRLAVEGYVSGIVVFCETPMRIQLEGHLFSKLRKNGNAYSYFPKVRGAAVWPEEQFQLHFNAENTTTRLAVRQVGYDSEQFYHSKIRIPFRYHGTRLAGLETDIPDFGRRLSAIGRGIAFVEEAVGAVLVSEAVILDFSAVENAITRNDSDAIWFYIETFRGEPIAELETIAAHEALHKYVDRRRLALSTRIREQFSDLKGYGPLSLERFLMVSQGIVSSEEETPGNAGEAFFRFINEKHFIENRKGGHAGDNLDEFCTSFIHSMLHIHRLEANLNRPLRQPNGLDRFLTGEEKRDMLDAYVGTIEAFQDAVSLESSSSATALRDTVLLRQGLALAKQIRGSGVATASAVEF